jgi:hypothetical protein
MSLTEKGMQAVMTDSVLPATLNRVGNVVYWKGVSMVYLKPRMVDDIE